MRRVILAFVVCLALSGLYTSLSYAQAEPLTPCEAEPTDMPLNIGEVISCTIDPPGDSDLFRFQGVEGTVVLLTILDLTNNGCTFNQCPVVQLFEPGNPTPIQTPAPGTAGIQLEILQSGSYTLRVSEAGNDHAENYRIGLERLFPPSPTALPLCYGCVVSNVIDPPPDRDFFVFEGAQGATISLTLSDLTNSGCTFNQCPAAQLFDPDRNLLNTLGPGTGSVTVPLPLDGNYTVHVFEAGADHAESYNLALECVFPPPGQTTCPIAPPPRCAGFEATISGTFGNDNIIGTEGNDVIVGLGGNDVIEGRGGDDKICGGVGADTLFGGDGNDLLLGEPGDDALFGELGNDTLGGGMGRDALVGGFGLDKLFGDVGDDLLIGGGDADALNGGTGTDVCDNESDSAPAVGCEFTQNP